VYVFVVKSPMQEFEDYVERDLDTQQTGSGVIGDKEFNWNEGPGGLVLGISSMPLETYQAIPIKRSRIGYREGARVNKLRITIGDNNYQNSQTFLANNSLIQGAQVILRRTYRNLDTTDATNYRVLFRGTVTGIDFREGNITLEVSERYFEWRKPVNKRVFSKICNWVFKDQSCGYVGAETFCDKTYSQCQAYSNTDKFGGFPEVPGLQFYGIR
jgi:hypothetical protein